VTEQELALAELSLAQQEIMEIIWEQGELSASELLPETPIPSVFRLPADFLVAASGASTFWVSVFLAR